MADEYGRIENPLEHPGLQILTIGVLNVFEESDDPEDTLMLSLTREEMALIALGVIVAHKLFPELGWAVKKAMDKIEQVAGAQGFYPVPKQTDV